MVQFIHHCLLLGLLYLHVAATCQLSSATGSIIQQLSRFFTQNSASNEKCSIRVDNCNNYLCCEASNLNQDYCTCHLTEDCTQAPNNDCMKHCNNKQKCKCITFNARDDSCILTSSANGKKFTLSGNCSIGTNGLQFHSEQKSWIDALKYCQIKKSSLVQFTDRNSELQNTVNNLLQLIKGSQNGVWIGLERSIFGCNPTWKWLSGENVQSDMGSNDHATNNYCGKIIWNDTTKNSKWLDEDCFKLLPFICQGPE